MWKLHAKLLKENRRTDPVENKTKITKATDLKIGQVVLVIDHWKGTSNPTYTYDHRASEILNDSTPDGKERKCNIHHLKEMTPVDTSTNAFIQFQDNIKKTPCNTAHHQYN